jgi:hypothetical protein
LEDGVQEVTFAEAQDEVFGVVSTAWLAAVADMTAPLPVLIWPGEAVPEPDSLLIFGTPFLEVITKSQKTLRRIEDKSLFEADALFTMSIFAPKVDASALDQAVIIGSAVEIALSKASPSGNVWFRDARSTPVAGQATLNQVNVVVKCVFQNQQ